MLLPALCAAQASEQQLAEQRTAFRAAYGEAERGRWEGLQPYLPLLENYVLLPDLEGRALRASLPRQSAARLTAFLQAHPGHPEQRLIADRWLHHLAANGQWDAFANVWQQFGPGQPDRELACLALQARLATGRVAELTQAALDIWQVGFSQPRACDPVFAWLKRQGELTPARYAARVELALQNKQFALARYLARQLDPAAEQRVEAWRLADADPASALKDYPKQPASADERARVVAALTRLGYRDAARTQQELARLQSHYQFDAAEQGAVARRVALGKAQRHEPDAFGALRHVPAAGRDSNTIHWQLRAALRAGLWHEALVSFKELPPEDARSDHWQYWLARSRESVGDAASAGEIYKALAKQRSLYGFLSADRLALPYAFAHQATPADPVRLARLVARQDIQRARELFLVGLYGRGRTLWERTMKGLEAADRIQAALLAHRWGWHSRAIATATKAGLHDDLELRYPVPRVQWTTQLNASPRVDEPYALGVARSESLFMSDVRSAAGAVGLMQLMPATGRQMARSLNLPYQGLTTLTDPNLNVRLGTAYLERMLERFAEHKVLATAAYNAGPHRVQAWLPDAQLPADVWMDSIPFTETRRYVRRVLESEAIVHWRLTGQVSPVSAVMQPIEPPANVEPTGSGSPRAAL
jgi:soluble lytic murein transglycosylase